MSYPVITIALGVALGLFLWNNILTIGIVILILIGALISGVILVGTCRLISLMILKGYISFQENSQKINIFLEAIKRKVEIGLIIIIHLLLISGVIAISLQAGILAGIILSIPCLAILVKIHSEMGKK